MMQFVVEFGVPLLIVLLLCSTEDVTTEEQEPTPSLVTPTIDIQGEYFSLFLFLEIFSGFHEILWDFLGFFVVENCTVFFK